MPKKDKDVKTKNSKLEDVKPEDVKPEDVKPEDVKPEDIKPEDVKPEDVKPEDIKPEDVKADSGFEVINPVFFDVLLMSHHPQESYGRCGYRFNKENMVRISADELTGEQISRLFEDPYLEVVPVIEED
ncbi:hypothetical protein [Pasteurella multocida]|uniref:hypothetical protein n=1 Tax=Pasteurella multocida TaxID=747 RepID=UPI003977EFC7